VAQVSPSKAALAPTGAGRTTVIEEMIRAFSSTVRFVEQAVEDVAEEEMVVQPPGVPNHATWTLGHLIHSCEGMATEVGGARWLPDDWESKFGYGSTPSAERQGYPGKAEMLALLRDAEARLCETLRAADDATLHRRLEDETFPTMVDVLMQVVVGHTAYHAGQLAVWRRAMGRDAAAVFI